jgi:hypothetical protein
MNPAASIAANALKAERREVISLHEKGLYIS